MKETFCISYLNASGEAIPLTTLEEKMEDLYGQLMAEAGSIEYSLKSEEGRYLLSDLAAAKLNSALEAIDAAAVFMDEYSPDADMTYGEIENGSGRNLTEEGLEITEAREWLLGTHKMLYALNLFNGDIRKVAAASPGQLSDISGLLKAMRQRISLIMRRLDIFSKDHRAMVGKERANLDSEQGGQGNPLKPLVAKNLLGPCARAITDPIKKSGMFN